ncbi:MAG: caspase family protein [Chloroflexota bacterium]
MKPQSQTETTKLHELFTNQLTPTVFTGSTLSADAGLPNWLTLTSQMATQLSLELPPPQWIDSHTISRITQAYINEFGLHSLVSFLKEQLDTTQITPTVAHRALAQLPVSLVFTASFDDLLERAYREAGKRVEVIVTDSDIPFMRQGEGVVNIVKLFGDLSQPKTLVVAQEQIESFFLDRPQMVKLLETELGRSTFLYLGWAQTDPHFNLIFGETLARYQRFMRPGYVVLENVTDAQRAEFRRKQIRVIDLPTDADAGDTMSERMAAWLTSINPHSAEASRVPRMPVKQTGNGDDDKPGSNPINSGKAWAVLVGVNKYEDPFIANLSVCAKDVTDIHQHLAPEYQSAKLLTDSQPSEQTPTRSNILAALSATAQAAEEGDLLLFYFSGHGTVDGGESYLLPRDARTTAVPYTAVAMRDINALLDGSAARAVVIILDACHSGANIGKSPVMSDEFIQRVFVESEGRAILASCKQGQLSYVWQEQQQSVFTHYLLEALQGHADFDGKGFVTLSDLNRYVVDGVKQWSLERHVVQTPTLQYTVAGDIVLVHYAPTQ